jgi:cytochrome c
MKNLARLSALALTSVIAMAPALAQCAAKCTSRCQPRCGVSASKCAAKCGAKCAAKCGANASNPSLIQRPAGYVPTYKADPVMVAAGKKLFEDKSLSTNGMSCATCHADGASYQKTFAQPFPHFVQMAKAGYGLDQIQLDEAIQMCMIGPMASKPFDWSSPELQDLAAFVLSEQSKFASQ